MAIQKTTEMDNTINLLTTTTGFVDIAVINAQTELLWIVPNALILDSLDLSATADTARWNDKVLPVFSTAGKKSTGRVGLVIEGSSDARRYILRVIGEPTVERIRISSMRDVPNTAPDEFCFQQVELEGKKMQIPDMNKLETKVFKR